MSQNVSRCPGIIVVWDIGWIRTIDILFPICQRLFIVGCKLPFFFERPEVFFIGNLFGLVFIYVIRVWVGIFYKFFG